jgi:transcriptional regulator with XRE-family HTH domain
VAHMQADPATIRAWRQAKGLTRREAAEWLGISRRTLQGLEQGRSPTSPLWAVLSRVIELPDAQADRGDAT